MDYTVVKEAFYDGPRTPEAPDLQYQMLGLTCIPKEDWGTKDLFVRRKNAPISGQHRFPGIFALAGPGVAAGRTLEDMHIRDTTPTLLYAVGEAVPRWMDGAIRGEVLAEPRAPVWDESPEPAAGEGLDEAFSEEQSKAIEESLRGLGYIQ